MATATAQPQQGMSIGVGGLRFNVRYSKTANDRGPSLRIYGDVDDKPVQLLRFDCFDQRPHYHYDPEDKNLHYDMDKTTAGNAVGWTLTQLRTRLPEIDVPPGEIEIEGLAQRDLERVLELGSSPPPGPRRSR